MSLLDHRPKISITIKLFFLFVSIGLIPIVFMSFYTFWQINRQAALEVENTLTDIGLRLKNDADRSIGETYRSVALLAQDPVFADEKAARSVVEREMVKVREVSPDIMGLFLLKGGQAFAVGGSPAFFMGGADFTGFSGTFPRITSPQKFPGIEQPAFLIALPVGRKTGSVPVTLLAAVGDQGLTEMTKLVQIGETGRAFIVDGSGLIVAGPDGTPLFTPFSDGAVTKRIMTIGEGIIHYVDRQNRPYIAFITTISGVQDAGPKELKVVISYREDEAYLVAGQIRKSFGFAIVIILVVTSLVSIALSGAIARPIKEIIRGTDRIGRGDFSQQITVRSQDEIGDLAQSFNRMAGELRTSREFIENYNRQLEQQVRERSRELEESERKYRMVVEGSGDAWTILDGSLVIQFANGMMGEFLGMDPTSLVGRSFLEFVSPTYEERIRQAIADVIGSHVSPVAVECEMRAEDAKRIMFEATLSAISNGASKGQVIAHLVDKTQLLALASEKEKLQLELMERSKHSQIGIMTEGLFHNLNNPLQALIGILKVVHQDVERELTEEGKLPVESLVGRRKDLIGDVNDAYTVALRLSDQVKNLLLKIRNESRRKIEDLDINGIIEAEVAFLEADLFFKHKIAKTLILSESLPRLPGVHSDVSQSFVNIVLNAVDAMRTSERRELTIETSLSKKKIKVTFHDTGTGIDSEHIPHIFDPFFTTKGQKGQGTGLGLFTVDFLLKPYDVRYEVKSAPGDTSFTILFPARGLKPKRATRKEG